MKIESKIGILILGISSIVCLACANRYDKSKMKEAEFDSYAIENLDKYRNFCEFIESNLEELIGYRNSKNYVTHMGKDTTYKKLRIDKCHLVVRHFHESGLPDELEDEFYSLVNSIEKKNLLGFDMCLDSTIEITIKGDFVGFFDNWEWSQYHRLEYKPKRDLSRYDYEIIRDTMLSDDFRYFIYLHNS